MKYTFVFVACLLALSSCSKKGADPAPAITPASTQEFEQYLQKEKDNQNIPAMAVLLFKGNTITYENYLGVADKKSNTPLNQHHIFLLASVSKTVTATALMQLYEQGKFKLDDKINDYLPFGVGVPGKNTPITFRMLLTHTSGIADGPELDNQYYYGEDSPTPLAEFMQNYLSPGGKYYNTKNNYHNFEPGTQHEYSNVGSALIGVLVERLSGLAFDEYCRQHIFAPLGMNDTYWRLSKAPTQNLVTPYDANKAIEHYTFTDYPNGALRSTVQDMFKILSAYSTGGSYKAVQLLKPETVDMMWQPQIKSINGEVGLHWFIMNSANNIWGHDGGEQGVATIMGANPDNGMGALIFTNQGDADLDNMLLTAYNYATKL